MEEDMDEGQTQKGNTAFFICMFLQISLSESDMDVLSVCQ